MIYLHRHGRIQIVLYVHLLRFTYRSPGKLPNMKLLLVTLLLLCLIAADVGSMRRHQWRSYVKSVIAAGIIGKKDAGQEIAPFSYSNRDTDQLQIEESLGDGF
ncbi:uncharacterized protein LOC124145174 isoform X1 [Haliotis rufescens]|uniref:uncharacterized protein LOC124145174 isoform X1 n=1 Tax=Haliotis rufescens TaxID=6454 RepID=UPI00201F3523|nr:uncharacterized protein LOC124145174 isoform X1 [Haliotis rufescens]